MLARVCGLRERCGQAVAGERFGESGLLPQFSPAKSHVVRLAARLENVRAVTTVWPVLISGLGVALIGAVIAVRAAIRVSNTQATTASCATRVVPSAPVSRVRRRFSRCESSPSSGFRTVCDVGWRSGGLRAAVSDVLFRHDWRNRRSVRRPLRARATTKSEHAHLRQPRAEALVRERLLQRIELDVGGGHEQQRQEQAE